MRPIRRRSSPAASTSHCVKVGVPPPAACLCRTRCFVIASCEAVTCAARCRARFIPRTCCSRACHSLDKACPAPWQTGAPPRTSCARPCRLARLTRTRVRRVHRVLHDLHIPAARGHRHQGLGGRRPHRWRARGHDDGRAARASWPWRPRGRGRGPLRTGGRPTRGRCSRPKGGWRLRERRARRRHGQGPTAGGMDMR